MNMFEEIEKSKAELPKVHNIERKIRKGNYNFYQIFALVCFAVILLVGVIMGNLFPSCGTSSEMYSGICLTTQFNLSLMICIWFIGFVFCLFVFAIGHIINLLDSINKKLSK